MEWRGVRDLVVERVDLVGARGAVVVFRGLDARGADEEEMKDVIDRSCESAPFARDDMTKIEFWSRRMRTKTLSTG
jgi:hypothetical protein